MDSGEALVRLDLSDNPMTAEVAPALAATIRWQSQLKVLNLNDTALSDEGASTVAEALRDSSARIEVRTTCLATFPHILFWAYIGLSVRYAGNSIVG